MGKKSNIYRIYIAFSAIAVGLCIYLIDRHPDTVYLIPHELSLNDKTGSVFGIIGNFLPTFLHVYIFIIFTAVLFSESRRQIIIICLSWMLIDSLFEIAQIDFIAIHIAENTSSWFTGIPLLENTSDYFLLGTFDFADLISILAGTFTAYITIIFTNGEPENLVHT
jgi:hypothetical protein